MATKPRLLLLGDSIRMNYQPRVAGILRGKADVVGPAENCQYSLYTLSSLQRWLEEYGTPDVVHWNNGLHDVGHNPYRYPVQIPLEMYMANITFILRQLAETGARVVWATITPVHHDMPFSEDQWSWRNSEIDQYNETALDVMREFKVPVNDLHAFVLADVDRYLAEDKIHLSDAGCRVCAEAVAAAVAEYLPK